jgi:hypothetical protein
MGPNHNGVYTIQNIIVRDTSHMQSNPRNLKSQLPFLPSYHN